MTTTHEQMKEILKPRIEALGFKVEDFDDGHIEGYMDLHDANIEITDNLINPKIRGASFATIMSFIGRNPEDEELQSLKVSIPYYRSEMGFTELKKIRDAINQNNQELLNLYMSVYEIPELTTSHRHCAINLMSLGLPYEYLLNPNLTKDELLDYYSAQLRRHDPEPDPNAKFNNPEFMRNLMTKK